MGAALKRRFLLKKMLSNDTLMTSVADEFILLATVLSMAR